MRGRGFAALFVAGNEVLGRVGDGAPGLLHGLLHAVSRVGDLLVDVVLDDAELGVDLDGGLNVGLKLFVQDVRVHAVDFFFHVLGFKGPVVPDGVA